MPNSYFEFKQFVIFHDRCSFKVGTDGVLLGAAANSENRDRILDIGTGSGLIAIMMAQKSKAEITAIEPDRESFQQACENVDSCKWKDRIRVLETDLQHFCEKNATFDLIVTNPPFFSNSLANPDKRKSGARHNATLSTKDLLDGVQRLLNEEGSFQLIMPRVEGNILIAEASSYGLYCNSILKIRPLPTSEIKRLILTFSRFKLPVKEKFLTIEHGRRHDFTKEYKALTADFYLKF
jgi:tRNA1Val (adenine37-N6)-methyltransferase